MTYSVGDRVRKTAEPTKEGAILHISTGGLVLVVRWDNGSTGTIDAADCSRSANKPKSRR